MEDGMGISFAGGGANQSFVYVDDLTMIRGAHSFRVGRRFAVIMTTNALSSVAGTYTFRNDQTALPGFASSTGFTYASFLLGAVESSILVYRSPTKDRASGTAPSIFRTTGSFGQI